MIPKVHSLVDKTFNSEEKNWFDQERKEVETLHMESNLNITRKNAFLDKVLKNEQSMLAINELERIIDQRNQHEGLGKDHRAKSIDQF